MENLEQSTYRDIGGLLIIDKPSSMTSRDVVNKISKRLNLKSVGHTGTLDPLATGVLVITLGKANKLSSKLTSEYKEYIAKFELGSETDTLDREGKVVKTSNKVCTNDEITDAILSFKGSYLQEVPLYSAVKVEGRRLYDYARSGIEVVLPKREVDIKEIEVISIDRAITIRTVVSKGTYIRSLIRDIGRKLGTYAFMSELKRTRQGKFSIEDAVSLDNPDLEEHIIDYIDYLDIEEKSVDSELLKKVSNGVKLKLDSTKAFVLFKYEDKRVAIYKRANSQYEMFIKY